MSEKIEGKIAKKVGAASAGAARRGGLRQGKEAARPGANARGRGRPGGPESRARLLEAAGKLFARDGFDAVSTRALARAAGANLAAITYHFGGKQGLYHAVLRQLVDDTEPLVAPVIERLGAGVKAAGADRKALAGLAAWFIRHLFTAILSQEPIRWQMAMVLREFYEPSEEFPMLLRERVNPLHDAVAGLVAAATGQGARAPETLLLTHAVLGQCMMFGAARTVVWARLDWDGYTPERVERIIATVTPAVLAMLGLPDAVGTKAVEAGA